MEATDVKLRFAVLPSFLQAAAADQTELAEPYRQLGGMAAAVLAD